MQGESFFWPKFYSPAVNTLIAWEVLKLSTDQQKPTSPENFNPSKTVNPPPIRMQMLSSAHGKCWPKVYSTVTPIYFGYQEIYTVYIVGEERGYSGYGRSNKFKLLSARSYDDKLQAEISYLVRNVWTETKKIYYEVDKTYTNIRINHF